MCIQQVQQNNIDATKSVIWSEYQGEAIQKTLQVPKIQTKIKYFCVEVIKNR